MSISMLNDEITQEGNCFNIHLYQYNLRTLLYIVQPLFLIVITNFNSKIFFIFLTTKSRQKRSVFHCQS